LVHIASSLLLLPEVVVDVEVCDVHVYVEIHEVVGLLGLFREGVRLVGLVLVLLGMLLWLEELLRVADVNGWRRLEAVGGTWRLLRLARALVEVIEVWHLEVILGEEVEITGEVLLRWRLEGRCLVELEEIVESSWKEWVHEVILRLPLLVDFLLLFGLLP